MPERIINLVCPKCKHGIKHDTLTGLTTGVEIAEYPEVNEAGRCWCKSCQHGTYPNEDGLCMECAEKGKLTRLQPKPPNSKVLLEEEKVDVVENNILTLEKTIPRAMKAKKVKQVIGTEEKKPELVKKDIPKSSASTPETL